MVQLQQGEDGEREMAYRGAGGAVARVRAVAISQLLISHCRQRPRAREWAAASARVEPPASRHHKPGHTSALSQHWSLEGVLRASPANRQGASAGELHIRAAMFLPLLKSMLNAVFHQSVPTVM